jgi:multidrug efflux pump subunit AcrA (membrane-fusion protein)
MTENKGTRQESVKDTDMQVLEKYAASEMKSKEVSDTIAEMPSAIQRGTLYLIGISLIFCFLILYFGKVAVIVSGKGKIIPKSGDYSVKAYEGGYIKEIFVKEGEKLTKGSPIVSIEPLSSYSQTLNLSREKIKLLESSNKLVSEQIVQEKSDLTNKKNRLEDFRKLLDRGLLSKMEFENEKERTYQAELSIKNKFKQIEETNLQIHSEIVQMEDVQKKISQIAVTMPIDGRIIKFNVQHVGQSVMPGYDIAVIAQENSPIMVQAVVENKDIAFIKNNQEVRIKVDAYPFQQFGTLPGQVQQILPDVTNEGKFIITVDLQRSHFEIKGFEHKVFPGLTVQTEIVTGYQPLYNLLFSDKESKEAK